jgi:diguanylate cyclase (GGDEF)-like protein
MDVSKEKARLELMVQSLLERIETNQRIQQHFHSFEAKLLASAGLSDLLGLIFSEMVEHFELADVGVVLVDSDYSVRDLLERLQLSHFDNRLQLRHSDDFSMSLYSQQPSVMLGELDALTSSRLFPNCQGVGSAALLPLMRDQQLIGSVHFASASRARFSADKSTDFMQHLASIVGVCLENCLAREHLRLQGQIDMLTQIRNRRSFEEEFAKDMERAERADDPVSCMFIDVDHFKKINDQFGHQAGDLCLKKVAASINEQLRKTDVLARYGGEEFVVLLPRCHSEPGRVIAERVRSAVAHLEVVCDSGDLIRPTVSVGLTTWQPVGERSQGLIKVGERILNVADEAMYQAKKSGRNQVVVKPFCQVV